MSYSKGRKNYNHKNMETKHFYESKTYIGLAVMILGLIVNKFGLPIAAEEVAPIVAFIFEGIGGVMIFIGRLRAEKKVSF